MQLRINKIYWGCFGIGLGMFFLASNCYAKFYIETSAGYANLHKMDGSMQVSEGLGAEKDQLSMDNTKSSGVFHLGFGYRKDFDVTAWKLQGKKFIPVRAIVFGLDAYYSPDRTATGTVYQYEDKNMDSYKFAMTANTARVMATGRVIFNMPQKLQKLEPYAILGLGVSSNYMKKFQETANADFAIPEINYNSRRIRQFAWQVGLGLSFELLKSLDLYAEYDYVHAGDIESDTIHDNQDMALPKTGAKFPLRSSELLFGIRYYLY